MSQSPTTLEVQKEIAREHLVLTGHVSLQIIQMLNFQGLEVAEFMERLERQRQDLAIAETVTTSAQPDELARVARQQLKLEATRQALRTFDNSANILAGSILQIVQQGMSRVHGSIRTYPNKGRNVAGVSLCDLVWQGRNQAMHYETTATRADWSVVFSVLDAIQPDTFSLTPPYESRAKAIFDLLGWQSYSVYEEDLKSLLLGCQCDEESSPTANAAS